MCVFILYFNIYNLVSSIDHLSIDKGQVLNMPHDALGKVNQYHVLKDGPILTERFLQ